MERSELNPVFTKMEISVRLIRHLLYQFEEDYGRDELARLMRRSGLPVEYFENEYNWVSYKYLLLLFNELIEYTGDENIIYKYGLKITDYPDAWGILKPMLLSAVTPEEFYKISIELGPRYGKMGENKILKIDKNFVKIESRLNNDLLPDINNCLHTKAQFASVPAFFGLPPAKIKDIQCASQGADSCIFELRWKRFPIDFKKLLPFYILLPVAAIINLLSVFSIISIHALWIFLLYFSPIVFFFFGHMFDYKIAIRNNSRISDEQNGKLIDAINSQQNLNEELQVTIEQRTDDLREATKKLDATLVQIEKTEKKLKLTERMTGVAHLAAGVAHEINNPMGAVCNYIQELMDEMPKSDPRFKKIEEANAATLESVELINSMLSFARIDKSLYITDVDVNDVINTIVIAAQQTSRDRIKVKTDYDPGLPVIQSDPMQINQAFTNLILNSFKSIKGKGEISIKTELIDDNIHVSIKDNGEVIPDYLLNRLFDPSGNELYGVGRKDLGIVMSNSIIRRFDGDIKVLSTADKGTSFDVFIPYN